MASFAKIGLNGKVIVVQLLNDDVMQDANGNSTEALGVDFLTNLTGWAVWKQTSYNTFANEHKLGGTPFRKNYATVGGTYDEDRDAFIGPKPYASAVLNETTCQWEAPIPHPDPNTTSVRYNFNPETNSWEEISRE